MLLLFLSLSTLSNIYNIYVIAFSLLIYSSMCTYRSRPEVHTGTLEPFTLLLFSENLPLVWNMPSRLSSVTRLLGAGTTSTHTTPSAYEGSGDRAQALVGTASTQLTEGSQSLLFFNLFFSVRGTELVVLFMLGK